MSRSRSFSQALHSRGWVALLLLAGALLWSACFHREEGYRVLPWVALAPVVPLLAGRNGPWLGFLHGIVFWLASIPWIAHTLRSYGGLPAPVAGFLLVVLAIYLALYQLVWSWLGSPWLTPGREKWALLGLPTLWVSMEWLRGPLLTGFPWNLAAYAWVDVPGALALSSWVGPWGISFLVVFVNVGVGLAGLRRRPSFALVPALAALLALAVGARWAGPEAGATAAGQPVRLVQPNSGILDGADSTGVMNAYRDLLAQSHEACDVPGALVIWPESAAFPFVFDRDPRLQEDLRELAGRGCPVLVNSVHRDRERIFNSAFLLDSAGGRARYDKRHLVPWGEYVPLSDAIPFVGTLAREAGNFSPGEELRMLPWGSEQLGVAICFEIVFSGEVAERVREGASLVVTLTNDAWYGDSAAPRQHFRAARFRAAETHRPVLRAALTGISAFVAKDGSVRSRLGLGERGILRSWVVGGEGRTPYVRAPWLVPILCSLLAVFVIILGPRRRP